MKLSRLITSVMIEIIYLGIGYYFLLPAINVRTHGFWQFIFWGIIILLIGLWWCFAGWNGVRNTAKHTADYVKNSKNSSMPKRKKKKFVASDKEQLKKDFLQWPKTFQKATVIIICAFLLLELVGWASGSSVFHADDLQQIATIEAGDFSEDFPNISESTENIAIVDMKTAQVLGDRTIGNVQNSSWFDVDGEYNLIMYQGKYYRLSSLNYGGFFPYLKAKKSNGIPGYVLVNAENSEAKFISTKPYKFSPSGYFHYNLYRHIRFQYPTAILGTSYFEIDEEGTPYWVTPNYTVKVGIWGKGRVVNNFIVTDAVTGESEVYNKQSLPEWIDHSYELSYLFDIAEWHYSYTHGFFNTLFSKTDVNHISYNYRDDGYDEEGDVVSEPFDGYNSFLNSKGEVCFYTGITPANAAQSNNGCVLINTRTGEMKEYLYDQAGAEESSAQRVAQGLVQNYGYKATFPIVVSVDGSPTYLMGLKDKAGLIKQYALCNIIDYTQVVFANSIPEAISTYKEKVGITAEYSKSSKETAELTAVVTNIYKAEKSGTTYYYYTFDVSNVDGINADTLFNSSVTVNEEQVTYHSGVTLHIVYKTSGTIKQITAITKV